MAYFGVMSTFVEDVFVEKIRFIMFYFLMRDAIVSEEEGNTSLFLWKLKCFFVIQFPWIFAR